MIIGYTYSQKCNENAKKKRLIYFVLWQYFFVYFLKNGYQKLKCNNQVQFGIFLIFLTINIASNNNNKSSFQPVWTMSEMVKYKGSVLLKRRKQGVC